MPPRVLASGPLASGLWAKTLRGQKPHPCTVFFRWEFPRLFSSAALSDRSCSFSKGEEEGVGGMREHRLRSVSNAVLMSCRTKFII